MRDYLDQISTLVDDLVNENERADKVTIALEIHNIIINIQHSITDIEQLIS